MIPYVNANWNVTTGCTPCSPACENCWAAATAKRFPAAHGGWGGTYVRDCRSNKERPPTPFSQIVLHPDRLDQPLHWRKPRVVGVCMMGDWLHPHVPLDFIYRMLEVIARTPQHTYLTLTKRSERFARIGNPHMAVGLPNVWLGVSVWDKESWQELVPILLATPAAHRWVSYEPALGDLGDVSADLGEGKIEWVVAGCESIGNRPGRECDGMWLSGLHDQCERAAVPCYVKQMQHNPGLRGRKLFKRQPESENLPPAIWEAKEADRG